MLRKRRRAFLPIIVLPLILGAQLSFAQGGKQSGKKANPKEANSGQDKLEIAAAAKAKSEAQYHKSVAPFLKQHCLECHGAMDAEGELNLAKLDPDMKSISAARWAMVLSKLEKREMPPATKPRPSPDQIQAVTDWIQAEMKRAGKHLAMRKEYANGNKVPHALLFASQSDAPFDSPRRIRRLSPFIYHQSVIRVDGKNARGVVQPFSTPGNSTFRDMGAPKLDEPTTAALFRNALAIVASKTGHKIENGKLKKVGSTPKEFLRLFDPAQPPTDDEFAQALEVQFKNVLRRSPTAEEAARFLKLYQKNVKAAGLVTGARYTLATVYLLPDAIFRWELGASLAEEPQRVRLKPREIAFALAFALTERLPDGKLLDAAKQGDLDTRDGVADAVRRMLNEKKLQKPSIQRFFREYFEYDKANEVFKNQKEFSGHKADILIADTDRLIELILERDKQVLRELLTTNLSFVEYRSAAKKKEQREQALQKFLMEKKKNPKKYAGKQPRLPHASTYESYNQEEFSAEQPVNLPAHQRSGVLTQPAWLVAFSKSDGNDAIHRGKWIRERLLGGVVPDIPITVDAQLPEAPHKTLRERMAVTRDSYCFQCHTYMNRLGLPFEMYDHFGRYRESEPVLDPEATARNVDKKGKSKGLIYRDAPLDARGGVDHVDDRQLKGDVNNAVELLQRLAESQHVEQVFVRHAFRFWLGRNESLGDAKSLQAAHQAYRKHDGSMKELIVSLLSSDSFLMRVEPTGDEE